MVGPKIIVRPKKREEKSVRPELVAVGPGPIPGRRRTVCGSGEWTASILFSLAHMLHPFIDIYMRTFMHTHLYIYEIGAGRAPSSPIICTGQALNNYDAHLIPIQNQTHLSSHRRRPFTATL